MAKQTINNSTLGETGGTARDKINDNFDDLYTNKEATGVALGFVNTHKNAATLDHPPGSVTSDKIADNAVGFTQLDSAVIQQVNLPVGVPLQDTSLNNYTTDGIIQFNSLYQGVSRADYLLVVHDGVLIRQFRIWGARISRRTYDGAVWANWEDVLFSSALGVSIAQLIDGKVPLAQIPSLASLGAEPTIVAGGAGTFWTSNGAVKAWSNFLSAVQGVLLTGLSFATSTAVLATDTILQGIGKLQAQISAHTGNTSNPHSVTKAQVGLTSVQNTSDADKQISDATQKALDGVQHVIEVTILGPTLTEAGSIKMYLNDIEYPPIPVEVGYSPEVIASVLETGEIYSGWTVLRINNMVRFTRDVMGVVGTTYCVGMYTEADLTNVVIAEGLNGKADRIDGLVPIEQLPSVVDYGAIPETEKGAVNGIATLGADSKVLTTQIPQNIALSTTTTLSADADYIEFTGLDLVTDKSYKLYFSIQNGYAGVMGVRIAFGTTTADINEANYTIKLIGSLNVGSAAVDALTSTLEKINGVAYISRDKDGIVSAKIDMQRFAADNTAAVYGSFFLSTNYIFKIAPMTNCNRIRLWTTRTGVGFKAGSFATISRI